MRCYGQLPYLQLTQLPVNDPPIKEPKQHRNALRRKAAIECVDVAPAAAASDGASRIVIWRSGGFGVTRNGVGRNSVGRFTRWTLLA